ncbi:MAG: hypothetical protein ABIH72_02390 [archaeon]
MSFERAIKYCRLCFEYSSHLKGKSITDGITLMSEVGGGGVVPLSLAFIARDNATRTSMEALERVVNDSSSEQADVASAALASCRKCDYSSPKIIETTEKLKKED